MNAGCQLPRGFVAAGVHCGIKRDGALDLGLIVADAAFPAAALFTKNHLLGAHIPVCRRHLAASDGNVRAVLVNSGNANCATGSRGEADNEKVCQSLAHAIGCPPHEILFLSTGVIGAALQSDRIEAALPNLLGAARADGVSDFATAIMTTDTHPKVVAEGTEVCGIAKGSGMIHPDMATMLAFLVTRGLSAEALPETLRSIADQSFHCVTVDGDTSPNDTFLLWSAPVDSGSDIASTATERKAACTRVGRELARTIAADGEGATRLVTLRIEGAATESDARHAGRFIARSPLVKTAIFGRDPNWGRILSSAATAGVPMTLDNAVIAVGGHTLFANGKPRTENEPAVKAHMESDAEIEVRVDLAAGDQSAEVWTCDLSVDYVRINADYRT